MRAGSFYGDPESSCSPGEYIDPTEHEALEQLALFSILARWIGVCEVESLAANGT